MSWQHFRFLLTILIYFWVRLISDRRTVLGIKYYRDCWQLFIHWRSKLLIKFSYLIFVSYINSIFKFQSFVTKNHRAIGFSKLVHQFSPITGIMLYILSSEIIIQSISKSLSVVYTLWNTYHNHSFIVQMEISNVF